MQRTNRSLVGQGSTNITPFIVGAAAGRPLALTAVCRVYSARDATGRTISEKRSPLLHMAINLDAKKIQPKSQWQKSETTQIWSVDHAGRMPVAGTMHGQHGLRRADHALCAALIVSSVAELAALSGLSL